jgi:hypothetical protein
MAKKKVEDFKMNVDTKKVDIHVEKKDDKFKAEVNTEKIDVKYEKGTTGQDFDLDSKKLDIHVKKDENGTTVEVDAENGLLKKIGTLISKIFVKKFGGSLWDADHIVPVKDGGGLCGLDNMRTLCISCHKIITFSSPKK